MSQYVIILLIIVIIIFLIYKKKNNDKPKGQKLNSLSDKEVIAILDNKKKDTKLNNKKLRALTDTQIEVVSIFIETLGEILAPFIIKKFAMVFASLSKIVVTRLASVIASIVARKIGINIVNAFTNLAIINIGSVATKALFSLLFSGLSWIFAGITVAGILMDLLPMLPGIDLGHNYMYEENKVDIINKVNNTFNKYYKENDIKFPREIGPLDTIMEQVFIDKANRTKAQKILFYKTDKGKQFLLDSGIDRERLNDIAEIAIQNKIDSESYQISQLTMNNIADEAKIAYIEINLTKDRKEQLDNIIESKVCVTFPDGQMIDGKCVYSNKYSNLLLKNILQVIDRDENIKSQITDILDDVMEDTLDDNLEPIINTQMLDEKFTLFLEENSDIIMKKATKITCLEDFKATPPFPGGRKTTRYDDDTEKCMWNVEQVCLANEAIAGSSTIWENNTCYMANPMVEKFCNENFGKYDVMSGKCHINEETCYSAGGDYNSGNPSTCTYSTSQKIGEAILGTNYYRGWKEFDRRVQSNDW